ncbi:MAG: heme o synthase, partial [Myxococcota bacterium]
DIDRIMSRTAHRPLITGELTQTEALAVAGLSGIGGVLILTYLVNPLAALMGIAGHAFYVVLYTMILKRRTPQNIVIGGGAGAFPPLIGWAAVAGELSLTAWLIFTIIFLWTPPHFWALALYKDVEYEKANIPMMPVVRGHRDTKFQMLVYTLLLVGCTTLIAVVGLMGIIYLVASVLLGAGFAYYTIRCAFANTEHTEFWAKRLFAYSILYVALLFGAMSLDGAYQWHFTERNHLMSIEREADLRRSQQSREDILRRHNGELPSSDRPR